MIEQAKFTYSSFGKSFEKQIKRIENQGRNKVEGLKFLKPAEQKLTIKDVALEDQLNEEAEGEIEKKMKEKVKREDLVHETDKSVHNFQQHETIRSLCFSFAGKITLGKVNKDRRDLLNDFIDFKKETRPRDTEKKN